MAGYIKKIDGVKIQCAGAGTFTNILCWKLWEYVVKIDFLIMTYGYNDVVIMNSSCHLHHPKDVLI